MTDEAFTLAAMFDAIERAISRLKPNPIRLRHSEREYEERLLRAVIEHLTPRDSLPYSSDAGDFPANATRHLLSETQWPKF